MQQGAADASANGKKGFSPTSIQSYRDAPRMLLIFIGRQGRRAITRLATFLGHVNSALTATYFALTGEILKSASERFGVGVR